MKKIVSGMILLLLFASILKVTFEIKPVKGTWTGTVYIRTDGSIDPPDAPIQRDGNVYTLTGNITSAGHGIVVERDNIVIDGEGYTIEGSSDSYYQIFKLPVPPAGVFIYNRNSVIIEI